MSVRACEVDQSRALLSAVAIELELLSGQCSALQSILTSALRSGALDRAALQDVQAADLLAQMVGELARCTQTFLSGERQDGEALSRAIGDVVLGALAQRLNAACFGSVVVVDDGAGVELF